MVLEINFFADEVKCPFLEPGQNRTLFYCFSIFNIMVYF